MWHWHMMLALFNDATVYLCTAVTFKKFPLVSLVFVACYSRRAACVRSADSLRHGVLR